MIDFEERLPSVVPFKDLFIHDRVVFCEFFLATNGYFAQYSFDLYNFIYYVIDFILAVRCI